jgi:hypothetical protein
VTATLRAGVAVSMLRMRGSLVTLKRGTRRRPHNPSAAPLTNSFGGLPFDTPRAEARL